MADKICLEEGMRGRADRVAEKLTDKKEDKVEGRKEEAQMLRDLSEERIIMLENRRRGEV